MKRVIMAVCVLVIANPAFATAEANGKNDCMLYGKNCKHAVYSLPERIAKLKSEIAKGEKVYTPDELKRLERRLKEDNETIRVLNKPGGHR